MRTVKDESELPTHERHEKMDKYIDYLRSKSEPCVLMDSGSGECFKRADGQKWEWASLRVTTKMNGTIEREVMFGYCDTERYEYESGTKRVAISTQRGPKKAA